jgi:sialic acid synthase SpsE
MALYGHAAAIPQWVPGVDFLHCVSAYPTPVEQLNLAVLRETDDHCAIWSGLSDHTTHPLVGALAVAAGARIIEAHLKLDDTDPQNPDAPHARTPTAFADYVRNIRFAKAVMGDGVKRVMPSEAAMLPYRVQP